MSGGGNPVGLDSDFHRHGASFGNLSALEVSPFAEVSSMKVSTRDDLKTEAQLSEDADLIVNRTVHFVGVWIEEHVIEKAALMRKGVDAAEELASECIADADEEGIAPEDIQDEVGDLKEYIAEMIVEQGGRGSAVNSEPDMSYFCATASAPQLRVDRLYRRSKSNKSIIVERNKSSIPPTG
ncbi:hypothetical protein X754_12390 [Mesorhizobium sp. LNJC403B00]|nr:hypothetical protein X754_12390 [Mesorhizobium sp. LNJC403B00]